MDKPAPSVTSWRRILGGQTRQRRIRVWHWFIAALVYASITLMLLAGVGQGWMAPGPLLAWASFIAILLLAGFVAIRSGWSERFADPSLTMWQLSMGVIAVNWGYVICGPMRTSALFPLMFIFAFGAFSLSYRQIASLTILSVAGLATAIAIRNGLPAPLQTDDVSPLQVDVNNLLMILVVLPALALVAAGLSALRHKLRVQRAALEEALAEVERLAIHDDLTGLPNRRAILQLLNRSVTHARRGIMPFCIAMLDLDHFKQINDQFGHATGDKVLKCISDVMMETVREGDVFGRWGGEEFLLILPGATLSSAQQVLARMQAASRDCNLHERPITFSAGLVAYEAAESVEALVARADAALYLAKDAGRDRVVTAPSTGY